MLNPSPRHVIKYGRPIPQHVTAESVDSARHWFDTLPNTQFERLEWESHAWPGGYEIHYYVHTGEELCHNCANNNLRLTIDPDIHDWYIVASAIHWEGPPLICSHCGREIASAYGDPEDEDAQNHQA